jgi:hypothetical protein
LPENAIVCNTLQLYLNVDKTLEITVFLAVLSGSGIPIANVNVVGSTPITRFDSAPDLPGPFVLSSKGGFQRLHPKNLH